MRLALIVAFSENRVIGRDNAMPWHIPEDLKHFKRVTMSHPVVMGRKTFESIGRVLPGRENVILSRQPGLTIPGTTVHPSLEVALKDLSARHPDALVFVIGGGEIYRQALPLAEELFLTRVHRVVDGDATFPDIGPEFFLETQDPRPDLGLTWEHWVRKR